MQLRLAKIRPAELGSGLVPRPRLIARLNEGAHLPLILACAPPGFGKTTLVRQWIESSKLRVAWLTLDADDADPQRLIRHLVAAVRSAVPDFGTDAEDLCEHTPAPSSREIGQALAADLDRVEDPLVLVLDDYSSVTGTVVHSVLEQVLSHPTASLRLVIIARHEPPLPIQTLRGHGHVCEIRQRDFCFSKEETAALLETCLGRPLAPDQVAVLQRRFEGWPAGLHIQALTLRDSADEDLTPETLSDCATQVAAYLRAEVLDRQPEDVQHYLLRCSILERFNASLCEAVAGVPPGGLSGPSFLDHALREKLFVGPIDDNRAWFRFRQPFRGFLQARLHAREAPLLIRGLHDNACAWLEAWGHIDSAVEHAVAAGDPQRAGDILARHRVEMLNNGRIGELARVAAQLPEEVVANNLELQLLKVWTMPTELMPAAAIRIETMLAETALPDVSSAAARAELRLAQAGAELMTSLADPINTARMLEYAEYAVAHLPLPFHQARATARLLLAHARQMQGDVGGALDVIQQGLLEHVDTNSTAQTAIHMAECVVRAADADLAGVQDAARRCLVGADASWVQVARRRLAHVHYEWNELSAAEEILNDTARDDSTLAQLARVMLATGRAAEADAAVVELVALGDQPGVARAVEAEIAMRQGRSEAALRWAVSAGTERVKGVTNSADLTCTAAWILVSADPAGHLDRARELIELLRRFGEGTHNRHVLIRVHALEALEALLRAGEGDETHALASMSQALELAQPGGFIRLFVDLGETAGSLLARVAVPERVRPYLARIRGAFGPSRPTPEPVGHRGPDPLPDPLTDREFEVLELLGKRFSNKEIAKRLFISVETVKRHNLNVFQKLHVHRRREAVTKATELGILRQDGA